MAGQKACHSFFIKIVCKGRIRLGDAEDALYAIVLKLHGPLDLPENRLYRRVVAAGGTGDPGLSVIR